MNLDAITREMERIAGSENVRINEPMMFHTSFRVGGPADVLVSPGSIEGLAGIVSFCRKSSTPFFVMGTGTNLLVRDGGIRGVVVKTCDALNAFRVNNNGTIYAQAGARLAQIAAGACKNMLAGFEFAAGIPGTLGGAVVMNAGAYGREMKDVITRTTCLGDNGEIINLAVGQHEFGHRRSVFQKKDYVVLESVVKLEHGNKDEISGMMLELARRRREKQPLDMPSAGSIFKRPTGFFAGKLIEECGLKGTAIGGAQVSEKHCGFIINRGNATASDIIRLIEHIRSVVADRFGVDLQPEVRIIGKK